MGWLDFLKRKNTQPINEQVTERQAALKKLQEDVGNYPDFFASLFDRYWSNGNWWYPVSSLPSIGSDHNKKHGKDWYIFRTEQELRTQRDASRLLYAREPVAKTIEGNLSAFVIGKGMTYKIIAKKAFQDSIRPEMIQPWQAYLDEWFDLERWPEREQECYTCKVVDGEFFLRIVKYQGRLTVRRIEPEYITNPPGGTEVNGWYMGVNYNLRDAETPLAYCYWPDHSKPHEIIPASEIIHYKANVTRNVSRGVSDFFPIIDDLNSIAGLSDNMRDGATARAEIAYMWSIKNATPAAISTFAGTQKDAQTTNPITGKTDRSKGMKSGKAVAHGDNVEFTTMPQGDSQGYISVLQAALRMIGNRWCLPEYMISADASNNNYASIQVAGSPFTRFVEREQNALKRPFKQIVMMVLQQAAVQMVIPTSVLPMIDIEIGCDSPVIVDKLAEAQVNEIEVRNGVLSPQQWCMSQGRDFDQTQQQIDEWRDANMEAMLQQQGIPTESDGGDAEDEPVQESAQWDEHKHPRAKDGKFGSGGSSAQPKVKVSHDKKKVEPSEQEKDKLADDTVKAVMAARGEEAGEMSDIRKLKPYEVASMHLDMDEVQLRGIVGKDKWADDVIGEHRKQNKRKKEKNKREKEYADERKKAEELQQKTGHYSLETYHAEIISKTKDELINLGWELEHTSDYGSFYLSKDGRQIRLSDHAVPDTDERITRGDSEQPKWLDDQFIVRTRIIEPVGDRVQDLIVQITKG